MAERAIDTVHRSPRNLVPSVMDCGTADPSERGAEASLILVALGDPPGDATPGRGSHLLKVLELPGIAVTVVPLPGRSNGCIKALREQV